MGPSHKRQTIFWFFVRKVPTIVVRIKTVSYLNPDGIISRFRVWIRRSCERSFEQPNFKFPNFLLQRVGGCCNNKKKKIRLHLGILFLFLLGNGYIWPVHTKARSFEFMYGGCLKFIKSVTFEFRVSWIFYSFSAWISAWEFHASWIP